MNAGQRSARQLASKTGWPKEPICKSCRDSISRRTFASAATATADTQAAISHTPPVSQAASPSQAYQIRAGVVLSRPPQITRNLTPFEKSFFLYQKRLNERLALPFTRYFYFKKDTPADVEWKRKAKQRMTAARDIGVYNAYGDEGWNDEVLVGAQESEPDNIVEALVKDAEVPSAGVEEGGQGSKAEQVEKPMPRVTEADKANDVKSLNRALQRSLYLLVQNKDGRWTFPHDRLAGREALHQAAERILVQSAGVNMNTWVVGNHPIGHYQFNFPKKQLIAEKNIEELGEKTFFMKARIMAGQANLKDNKLGFSDFKWLTKEEIQKTVPEGYWSSIRNMLAEW